MRTLEAGSSAHWGGLNDENRQYLRFTGAKLIGLDVTLTGIVPITACSIDPANPANSFQFSNHSDLNGTHHLRYRLCYSDPLFFSPTNYLCTFGDAAADPFSPWIPIGTVDYDSWIGSATCAGSPNSSGSIDYEMVGIASRFWGADYYSPGSGTPPDVSLSIAINSDDAKVDFLSTRTGRGVSIPPAEWLNPSIATGSPFGYNPGLAYDFSSATCEIIPIYL